MGVGTLLIFSALMVALPLNAFFTVQQGRLDGPLSALLGPQVLQEQRLALAGALAVVCVNLVVAGFVVAAWLERPPPAASSARKEQ